MKYVLEKITVTESQPHHNTTRFFLPALRDDFKMSVRHVVVKKFKPRTETEEPKISEERAPDKRQ